MLCSDGSQSSGEAIYSDFVNWHPLQKEFVNNFHENLLRKKEIPSGKWRIISQHKCNYQKHINALKSNAISNGVRWLEQQKQTFSPRVTMLIDSQEFDYQISKKVGSFEAVTP